MTKPQRVKEGEFLPIPAHLLCKSVGKKVQVEGWAKFRSVIYLGTVDGLHTVKVPTSGLEHTTRERLMYTRSRRPRGVSSL